MTNLRAWGIALVAGLAAGKTTAAQSGGDLRALGEEVEALNAGQTAIQKEL